MSAGGERCGEPLLQAGQMTPRSSGWRRAGATVLFPFFPALLALAVEAAQLDVTGPVRETIRVEQVRSGRRWTPPRTTGPGGLLAVTFLSIPASEWSGDPYGMLAVVEDRRLKDRPNYVLSFYARRGRSYVETYRFATDYYFHSMRINLNGDLLITTWVSGSAYRTGIFHVDGAGKVRVVLWLGWTVEPEFISDTVIRAVPTVPRSDIPEIAEIFEWDGSFYKPARKVPWPERYRGLP